MMMISISITLESTVATAAPTTAPPVTQPPTTAAPPPTSQAPTTAAPATTAGRSVVSRTPFYDCDGSGHGYYEIVYSDGSIEYEEF